MYFYHDEERKIYDTTSVQCLMDIWEHIIPENDTESFARIQLRPRYKVMKVTRKGYNRMLNDATQRVNSKHPELTGNEKHCKLILELCRIINKITYADIINLGDYPTPWQRD